MLNPIIKFSLNNKLLVLFSSAVLVVLGIQTARQMEIDVFPDFTAPTVVIMTDAHGMASEEVERLVTFPVETAVNGATGVRRVRSVSSQGFSFVWVEFDWGTDIFRARQVISEKLTGVLSQMPLGVSRPELAPQSSIMGEILFVSLQSDTTSLMDLRTIAEWNLKPLILATGGVSQVTIMGGDYRQYQILMDPQRMKHFQVTLSDMMNVCDSFGENSSGGVLREYGNEYVVRGIARTADIEELGNSFVKTVNGKPVRLRDVAGVRIGAAPKMGYASGNAKPAVIISISKQSDANTLELTRRIEEKLAALQKTLPPDVVLDTKVFRQAGFIETSVNNVQNALIEGAVFVVIVLFIFLGSFRTTAISLLAIPLSLIGALIVIKALGMNINTMSLGGMAIAVGSLVDDAIIAVENIYKRLRQNRAKPVMERIAVFDVVYQATEEIMASMLNATLIIIVAFLPLFFLSGMEGRMLRPLGVAFIVSLFVSLIVAVTLTPLLSKLLLSRDDYLLKYEKEKWLVRKLIFYYEISLAWALSRKRFIVLSVIILFVLSLCLFASFGRTFLPEFNEGSLTLSVYTLPGSSLEENNALGNLTENELLSIPEIYNTARRTGRGELDEHSLTSNSAEIDVNFSLRERNRHEFMADVRETLSRIPGIAFTVGQPLGHRIDHMLSGTRANIAIKLFGTDLNKMFSAGNEIKNAITDIEGLVDVNVEQQVETPQIQIRASLDRLAHYGITVGEFNEFVDIGIGGKKLADIYEGQRRFDLVLRLKSDFTETMEGIGSALIDAENGKKVPLEQVADIVSVAGPGSISRENVQRKIVVSANVSGRDLRSVVEDIKEHIGEKVQLPEGYRVEYGGQFESEASASRTLLMTSVIAVFVIFMLLFLEFRNVKLSGIILLNLPLALIGGVFAIALTSGVLSIPSIIGFITLFGIATRNGILLISNYQRLRKQGVSLYETVTRGSSDRLNAILMTALTAGLALIPLALRGDLSGNEIQSPMAIVILGGLLTSTFLNIYLVPVVYSILCNRGIIKENKL